MVEESKNKKREYNRLWMEHHRRLLGIKANPKISAARMGNFIIDVPVCKYCGKKMTLSHDCPQYAMEKIIQVLKRDMNSQEIADLMNVKLKEVNKKWTPSL